MLDDLQKQWGLVLNQIFRIYQILEIIIIG